jgi:hypothetical protein
MERCLFPHTDFLAKTGVSISKNEKNEDSPSSFQYLSRFAYSVKTIRWGITKQSKPQRLKK